MGLLEMIQYLSGCMYLSDLRDPCNLPAIRSALRKIEPKSYSLYEWNYTVSYITDQVICVRKKEKAYDFLRKFCMEKEYIRG